MKNDSIRFSSANGEVWVMATFKVKYCHKIFSITRVREVCYALLEQAMQRYLIRYDKIGFDEDHVHILLEIGLHSKPEIAKKIKGYTARKLLKAFPWVKKKYFWGSGFWNPAYDIRSHDKSIISKYLDKQKYSYAGQKMLTAF
jgi:REP element-mobilizing transposase RayT|tara:strand:- start:572 stop:1000 length:429 start_codon:yes stop_codon:yes gene_type:complete